MPHKPFLTAIALIAFLFVCANAQENTSQTASVAAFERLDENHDGFIDEEEWNRMRRLLVGRMSRIAESLMNLLDIDKDGKVTRDKFARIISTFTQLDQRHGGVLTQEELNRFFHAVSEAQKDGQSNTTILFTGKLLGYFRIPDEQSVEESAAGECPKISEYNDPVGEFLKQANKGPNTILVGTGDNFAPELLARIFKNPPNPSKRHKDDYTWDWKQTPPRWVVNEDANKETKKALALGQGRIPMDNVACFLAHARFDAIVPGKEDFYFGPERLRYLARFLASIPKNKNYQPVQMLAANLVVETSYANDEKPRRDHEAGTHYLIPSMSAELAVGRWKEVTPVNFSDNGKVLPWLRTFIINPGKEKFDGVTAELCTAHNETPHVLEEETCRPIINKKRVDDNYAFTREPISDADKDLLVGQNYFFCMRNGTRLRYCVRFSVYAPFFSYKAKHPNDPDPYFYRERERDTEVAVFGVVDQEMRQHIGQLNFVWNNTDHNYRTEVVVIDPVVALTQLLQRFDADHPNFTGLKVLLAQMSAPRAKQVAARMGGQFNIVISAAQLEHATPDQTLVLPENKIAGKSVSPPAFMAVPPPYYNPVTKSRTVEVRKLTIEHQAPQAQWKFSLVAAGKKPIDAAGPAPCPKLKKLVVKAAESLAEGNYEEDPQEAFRVLTLHMMLKHSHADVALIQKRDIFWQSVPDCEHEAMQDQLDRILWKGDFLIQRHVLGSTLLAILKRAKQFDAEDQSPTSVSDEQGRGLLKLGLQYDGERDEYLVNGNPIDPNRPYTVATTDYIGLGDTGFSELAAPMPGDPARPRDFNKLLHIASLVCQEIGGDGSCEGQVRQEDYFDDLAQQPSDLSARADNFDRLKDWASYQPPQLRNSSLQERVDAIHQDRRILAIALERASFGFSSTRHRFGEDERSKLFAGIPLSQLSAHRSHSWDFDQASKLIWFGKNVDLYTLDELRYSADITRQEEGPTIVNQKNNLLAAEGGLYLHSTKGLPRLMMLVAPRYETQFSEPINVFALASGDKLVVGPGKSHSLLLKLGPRWENRKSSIEGGYQFGAQFNAIDQYVFNPGTPSEVICRPTADTSIPSCIKNSSLITLDSDLKIERGLRFRNGFFLNFKVLVPLHPRLSYLLENRGEFFFTRGDDNSTDTRYVDDIKQTLSIPLIGSLFFEPKFEVFLYQNKVQRTNFWQTQAAFTVTYKFNWFRGNKWHTALWLKQPDAK